MTHAKFRVQYHQMAGCLRGDRMTFVTVMSFHETDSRKSLAAPLERWVEYCVSLASREENHEQRESVDSSVMSRES